MLELCLIIGFAFAYFIITADIGVLIGSTFSDDSETATIWAYIVGLVIAVFMFVIIMHQDPRFNMIAESQEVITEVDE